MPFEIVHPAPTQQKPVSTGEDVLRSAATGGAEGLVSIPGAVGDLRSLADNVVSWGAQKIGVPKADVDFSRSRLAPPVQTAMTGAIVQYAKKFGIDPRMAKLAAALLPGNMMAAPGSSEILGAMTGDKPLYQPQTVPGQYARTLAQFAPGGLAPSSLPRRIANVAVPALLSETAGQVTKGTPAEPYARLAAALAGAGGVALTGRGGAHTRLLADASRPATDAQIAEARALMEEGARRGVRLTLPEAVQQVTNAGTALGRMQRVVEGTKAGNARIAPVMAQRPAQVQAATTDFGNSIAPVSTQPSLIGPRAQTAAQGVLDGIRQRINGLARPHYEAAEGTLMPPDDFRALMADEAYAHAAQEVLADPVLGPRLQGLPPNDLTVVDAVVKQLDRNGTASAQTVTNPGGNNELAGRYTGARGAADEAASAASPDWREARDIGAMGRQALLAPTEAGPVGQIAATDNVQGQIGALYPNKPLAGAPAETAAAVQALNAQDPNIARALTRQHILSSANEAMQANAGGVNQWGGAKWAAQIAGNPEQAQALQAGVRASGGDASALDRLLEVLRATGKRQLPGSMTAYNAKDIEELGKAGVVGEVMRTGMNPPGTFRRIGEGFQNWQTERNADRLAQAMLANPADAERILLHARQVVPRGQGLETIERLAIAAQLSRQPQLERQSNAPR